MDQHAPDLFQLFAGFCRGTPGGSRSVVLRDEPDGDNPPPMWVELRWETTDGDGRTLRETRAMDPEELFTDNARPREIGLRVGREMADAAARRQRAGCSSA